MKEPGTQPDSFMLCCACQGMGVIMGHFIPIYLYNPDSLIYQCNFRFDPVMSGILSGFCGRVSFCGYQGKQIFWLIERLL
jgi:hypothetical protein